MQTIFHILTIFVLLNFSANSQNKKVVVITADCAIHPACADYIHTGLKNQLKECRMFNIKIKHSRWLAKIYTRYCI